MILPLFMRNPFLFVKQTLDTKKLCSPRAAVDGKFIHHSDIIHHPDGRQSIPLVKRGRPYLPEPYADHFCDAWKNGTGICDEDCKECKPFDTSYWSGHGLGFLTGSVNKVVVLDIDPDKFVWEGQKGKITDPWEIVKIIKSVAGDLPMTWTVQSQSGGLHFYYRYDHFFKTSTSAALPGIDLLGNGGKITFPCVDSKYEWVVTPSRNNLAKLPAWMLGVFNKPKVFRPKSRPAYVPGEPELIVKPIFDQWPIQGIDTNDWLAVGFSCGDLGISHLFEAWSKTDDPKRIASSVQFRSLANGGSDSSDPLKSIKGIARKYGVDC